MRKRDLIIILLLLLLPFLMQGETVRSSQEAGKGATAANEILLVRQKNFIYRIIDDINKSISFTVEDIDNLESRMDSITFLEPETRDKDLFSIKSSYEHHLEWLYKMKEAFERDYDRFFTDAAYKGEWVERCAQMVENHENFQIETKKSLAHYEKRKERLVYYLNRQKFLMTETQSLRNEIAALQNRRDLTPSDESYLKSLKNKLWAYQVEMNAIASYKEEMYLHYLLFIEQLSDNRDWLVMKTGEYKALASLAGALHYPDDDTLQRKYGEVISIYEKEMTFLKKKKDRTGAKDWSITPYGEIREVERFEEMIDYYERMKSRYDDYIRLLSAQADGFRADMEMKL